MKAHGASGVFGELLADENGGVGRDSFHTSGETKPFGCGGFDADSVWFYVHKGSEYSLHSRNVRIDFGAFCTNGAIDVADVVAARGDEIGSASEKDLTVDASELFTGVWEVVADVAHISGAEHSVANSVDEDIGIAMAEKSVSMFYLDAAEPKIAPFDEFMDVVAHSYTNVHNQGGE